MTLSTATSRNDYLGTGTVGPFPFTFKVFAATDLEVVKTDATGVEVPLSYITDYTVAGVSQATGGSITLLVALASGYTLTIRRVRPLTQTTDFRDQGAFFPELHEDALDHLTMIAQQQEEAISRAVTLPVGASNVSAQLPTPAANKALFWKADGTALENRTIDPGLTVTLPAAGRTTPDLTTYLANNAVVNPYDFGAKGRDSGVDTDGAKFLLAQTAAGAAGQIDGFAGTFQIETNLNFSQFYNPRRGHVLRPRSGVNINFGGGLADGTFAFLDLSLGGTVSFSGPLSHVRPEWFSMKGDGVNADWAPLLAMVNSIPKWTHVRFRPGSIIRLDYAWPILNQQGLLFECPAFPSDAFTNTNNAIFKWYGVAGGSMILNYNTGYCVFRGLAFDPGAGGNVAAYCIDTDEYQIQSTATSQSIWSTQVGGGAGVNGCSFFNSLAPNIQIALQNAGPAAAVLKTSLSSVQSDQQATLAVAASTSVQFNSMALSPAGYAAPPNPFTRISTQTLYEYCQFNLVYGTAAATQSTTGVAIARNSGNNCEYNAFRFCQFKGTDLTSALIPQNGNNSGRAYFNTPGGGALFGGTFGWSAPTSSDMMTAGSNAIGNFTVDTFSPSMNGMLFITHAGAAGLGARGFNGKPAPLVGYFKYLTARSGALYQDAGLTTALNAATNSGTTPFFMLGRCAGVGVLIGPHQNSKRHAFWHCEFNSLAIGLDAQGGSHHHFLSNFPNNDLNTRIGNSQSEPSSEYASNSENSRQHIQYGANQPYTIEKSRFALGMVYPSSGYFAFVSGAAPPQFSFIDNQVENLLPASATVFSFGLTVAFSTGGTGVPIKLEMRGCRFPDMDTLSAMGFDDNALANSSVIYQRANLTNGVLPYESILTTTSTNLTNALIRSFKGTTFFEGQYAPVAADFVFKNSFALYVANSGSQIRGKLLHNDGTTVSSHWVPEGGPNLSASSGYGGGDTLTAGTKKTFDIALTGAKTSDYVLVMFDNGGQPDGIVITAKVNAADNVHVVMTNATSGSILLTNGSLNVMIIR